MAMRSLVVALVAWTVLVVLGAIVIGSPLETPPCAHLVAPPPTCAGEIAAENARVWATHTVPLLVAAVAGYAAIALVSFARARRRARVGQRDTA